MSLYSLADLDSIEPREIESIAPTLLPIGPALESEQLRPSVWHYERGEENTYHRQDQQEEFYLVLEGTVDVTVERDDERDVVTLTRHECMVVPPESWRQIEAVEESRVLVVGAPNVADDAVLKDASEQRS
ncbi:cupin 2 barrel domain protein [Natrialba magadii ATCC 43099]|uniref:Cupin 2 barrel domain protein n=1 Tax=Natrialba magadii (strain ATCC 43099 / DSM 3394 / CCM 3739 / CIP 104546 / IAM 13178 / JCM 8861 / NBRC 102185 / NCIMB 2190 / MS3) TaxID=547559 RepID=D3STW5_NATMM|nr:cupin domain-containing protein [Natrialba magadii]ADD07054.1 cupin 2 barrel domain protein [Natrialba magadii ATCC 43099]ELY28803.1 cyclic nucleotide-binding protein [Natrialba magadii ATCC 43099]